MKIKSLIVTLLIALQVAVCSAQSSNPMAELQSAADIVRSKYATTQSMVDIYQMAGNGQGLQLCQVEMQYHNAFYNYLERLAQNPQQLQTPQGWQQYQAEFWEYLYRTENRDYRDTAQIQGNLQQYIARRTWESSTPEGMANYNARRQAAQADFERNQANHRAANRQFDNYMNGLRAQSAQDDKYHHQYVNTIHDRYEYVNPYDGRSYTFPNTQSAYPTMQNPDGSVTTLVPYQNY